MGPKKEALGLAPPPVPTARAPGVLIFGLALGGLPRLEVSPGIVIEGLRASYLRPLFATSSISMQHYSRKLRGNTFLKIDDSLIVEAVLSFSAPLVSSGVVTNLVAPSSVLVYSEEEDDDFWSVEDGVC